MKKIFTISVLCFMVFGLGKVNAQAVEQGKMLVDVYYGWPNLWSNIAKNAVVDASATNVDVGSIGPFGGRFEYMASDKMGFGADINYANTTIKWTESSTIDNNGNLITGSYNYKFSIPRLRAMFRFNLHFGGGDAFDGYWTIGAGYGSMSWKYETNDPYYNDGQIDFNYIPIAFRTGVGARYYFTDNIGLNAEIGFGGGPIMTFGASFKF